MERLLKAYEEYLSGTSTREAHWYVRNLRHVTRHPGAALEWEIVAPQRLGIYAIWHDGYGVGLPRNCPIQRDRIIRHLSELLQAAAIGAQIAVHRFPRHIAIAQP